MSADCLERSQLPRRSLLAGLLLACSVGSVAPMQAQVPDSARKKAVQDTIKKAAGSGTVDEVEKEVEDGKTVYSADITVDGKKYDIEVSEDGKLLKKEAENDKDDDKKDEKKEDKK